ncbi:Hypothetical protein NTJ_15252 [Nesidiocoris tenuis]|uniref:Uncharacterized protein n=1 Tax=Nesidiocoris tenuis TaxID=355587 RepID=A0ABN7BDH6_9HEMI|nr:Hypothetical protein NTJ_15252 [Nesidiocoris tenuis]
MPRSLRSYEITGCQKPSGALCYICSIVSGDMRFMSSLPQSHAQVTGIRWKHRISETIRSSRCYHLVHCIRRHEIQELSAAIPFSGLCNPMETQDFRNHLELAVLPSAP